MLTPQMIDAMNKATGGNVPLSAGTSPVSAPVKTRAQEIGEIADKALADREKQRVDNQSFGGKVIRSAITPFAKVATSGVNLAQDIAGKEETTPFSGNYLGKVDKVGKGFDATKGFTPENVAALKDAVKNGVDIGTLIAGGGGAAGVVEGGLKAGIKQGVIQGAKLGAATGAVSGASTGLEEGATVGSTIKNTITGGLGGAALGAAGGAVAPLASKAVSGIKNLTSEAGKAARQSEKAIEAITPKVKDLKPKDYEKLLNQKRVIPKSANEPAKYVLSDSEKATAQKYQHLLQNKDPVKNSFNVMDEIANQDKQVGEFLTKNNGAYNSGELKNFISEKLKGVSDITVPQKRVINEIKTMVDNFSNELPKNDMKSLWEARKAFDSKIESAFGGSPTLSKQLKRGFRNAVQDFIAERTPDSTYKNFMKEMSNLYEINDNLVLKAQKQRGLSAIKNWAKENPTTAKVLGIGGVAALGSTVYGTAHTFTGQ